jgi:hypothetical protein
MCIRLRGGFPFPTRTCKGSLFSLWSPIRALAFQRGSQVVPIVCKQFKVVGVVVRRVIVNVVNNFHWQKEPPQLLLHHKSVFPNVAV